MSARLLLRCGCAIGFRDEIGFRPDSVPLCPAHGAQGVVRVVGMPRPRFRGTATGPCVETVDLEPWTGQLVGPEKKD